MSDIKSLFEKIEVNHSNITKSINVVGQIATGLGLVQLCSGLATMNNKIEGGSEIFMVGISIASLGVGALLASHVNDKNFKATREVLLEELEGPKF